MWNCLSGDMHFKDILGSIVRVGYCIPVPDKSRVLNPGPGFLSNATLYMAFDAEKAL